MASFEEEETRDREAKIAVEDVPSTEAMPQVTLFSSSFFLFVVLTLRVSGGRLCHGFM